jgi:hypothetical protein
MNCEVVDTQYGVLQNIGNMFIGDFNERIPFTGWSTERVYNILREKIDETNRVVILVLDEIDKLVYKSGDDVLYHLSRINDDLQRAKGNIGPGGVFHGGRFQLRANSPQFLPGVGWSWDKNPFAGTRELNGLKVIMMLTSNWDNKDIRDSTRGSNTAIFRADEWGGRYVYLIDDWGSAMGAWGHVWSRSKWNCADYSRQTPEFVKGVKHGYVQWGYHGQHTKDETRDIRVDDIRWLLRYLGRITDGQIRDALRASGATPEQVDCFASAVRERIDQLKSASDGWGEATANTSRP